MTDTLEMGRWHKDAVASLSSAERAAKEGDHRATVQHSQLAVELFTKSVVAYFSEVRWVHDPSDQLRAILGDRAGLALSATTRALLGELAEASHKLAPWHGWSSYGKEEADGMWATAVDLCTAQIAAEAIELARKAGLAVEAFAREASVSIF